jgi:hypothetical protein
MQRGQIFQASGSWYVRYYAHRGPGGRVTKRLGRVSAYPRKELIEPLARELMASLDWTRLSKYRAKSLGRFIEEVYLPHAETRRSRTTLRRYRSIWSSIGPRCGDWTLQDVWTSQIEWLLKQMAKENGWPSSYSIKRFLSKVFQFACQQGRCNGNPAAEVYIPRTIHVDGQRGQRESSTLSLVRAS